MESNWVYSELANSATQLAAIALTGVGLDGVTGKENPDMEVESDGWQATPILVNERPTNRSCIMVLSRQGQDGVEPCLDQLPPRREAASTWLTVTASDIELDRFISVAYAAA